MSEQDPAHHKLWGGRFSEPTDRFVERFTASIGFDARLYHHDIQGSIAHARMLASVGVITSAERDAIVGGLETIRGAAERGEIEWSVALEDVHMNIESRLIDLVGEVGKKLHTARSRNDQIATDVRLYLRDAVDELDASMSALLHVIVDLAERHAATVMPGFTHLQTAQPVTFGHHLLAWFEMLLRDRARLRDGRRRLNVLPLGSAALAGTTFPIDRSETARALAFDAVSENSLDAVSDRDFAIEFCATASIAMMHLSRWCEELVLWSSQQFRFVSLPDRFCTGSSIMPQKKNPDVPELVRGKSGRVFGDLMALLTLMKGQPLAYNKDNQEDKEPLFDAVDTLGDCLAALRGMLPHIAVDAARMRAAAAAGHATATDLADHLVRKGRAFRDAHEIVGRAVAFAEAGGKSLADLSLAELRRFAPDIDADAITVLTLEGSIAARDHVGGTAPAQVSAAAARARARI
jgi:argininosuccinate lyase